MADNRPVFFFDIDNCLYSRSKRVHDMMSELIDKFFVTRLSLTQTEANELHSRYYRDYGLAIEGLVRHHKINALEYNSEVDDALPLENVLGSDKKLRQLLQDLDRTKVRPWLFTNAYVNHGKRVVKLLEIEDQFEGITYCDYAAQRFVCKPHNEMFAKAQKEAGGVLSEHCFFVDDSALNCKAAHALGWTAAHLVEPSLPNPLEQASKYQISDLEELRSIFPQFFKDSLPE